MQQTLRSQWFLGLCLLGVVVVLWVASGFFVNAMCEDYPKPYSITYLNTSLMALYLPFGWRQQKKSPTKFSIQETMRLSTIFFALWFLSNLLNNVSYQLTTVQSATILSCTSSFFTLIFGSYLGVEKFSMAKLGPLVLSVIGIALITHQDSKRITAPPRAILGNCMALGSALLYGVYTTLLKKRVGEETNLNTRLFFGFVGVITFVGLWPSIWLLDWFNIEPFELPPSPKVWSLLGLNGAAIMISDFCWVLSMLMTSPLVVSVGLSVTIPLSMLGEVLIYHRYVSAMYLVGAILVGYAFWCINRSEENDTEEETEHPRNHNIAPTQTLDTHRSHERPSA